MRKIVGDVFDIASRLKEIDDGYELYYDAKLSRFEVWARNRLQSVLPYKTLDARTIGYVRRTRVERAAEILAEIEADNAERERAAQKKFADCVGYKTKSLVGYLKKGADYVPDYGEL